MKTTNESMFNIKEYLDSGKDLLIKSSTGNLSLSKMYKTVDSISKLLELVYNSKSD